MTKTAKMKAQAAPATVRIRANLAAAGLTRGEEVTVAETPLILGGIDSGVFTRLRDVEPGEPEPIEVKPTPKTVWPTSGDGQV